MSVYNSVSLLFCGIIMLAKGQIYDAVVCSESTVPQTISCGGQIIIEIESVTVAAVHNPLGCSFDLISVVEQLDDRCKRTDVTPRDGKEVFRRCFSEESCTIDGSVVDRVHLDWSCHPEHRNPYANVLWFKYSCHLDLPDADVRGTAYMCDGLGDCLDSLVDPHSPSVALLPLPEKKDVRGLEVDIFSPYYPCFPPVPDVPEEELLVLDCSITPQRTFQGSFVTFTVLPKSVKIRQNHRHCLDYLHFDHGPQRGRIQADYCGKTTEDLEVWDDEPIPDTSTFNLHIKYIVRNLATGVKFWLRVKAVENRTQVNVSVTCSGQENFPPLPKNWTCSLLTTKTATTSATLSTDSFFRQPTTEAATTPSTNNSNQEQKNNEERSSKTDTDISSLLPGILGGVFGLLFVGAIIATLLCCVIRKRKRQTEEAGKSTVTETRRSRPKSIQEIVATIKKKQRAPNHPDEEMANQNNSKTKPEKPPKASKPTKPLKPPKPDTTLQTYVRPSSIAKMAALLKKGNNTKRKTTNNENKDDPEAVEKAVGKSMEINYRYEKTSNVNEASKESRYEHLYAVPLRKESKFSENDRSKSKTTEVNATNPDENDDPEAGNEAGQEFQNEQLYAVPIKKYRKIAESDGSRSNKAEVNATDTDETLMCENDDLYSSFQVEENNVVSEKNDGAQAVERKVEDTDVVAEKAVSKEILRSAMSGYENVKPDTTDNDKNNNDKINNETCTITVPDDFSNNPGSRISLA